MSSFLCAFRMDLRRAFASPLTYISVFAITAILILGVWQEASMSSRSSVLYLFHAEEFSDIEIVIGAAPFATAFCGEWRSRFTYYAAKRSSLNGYIWSKFVVASIAAGIVVTLGYAMFIAVLALKYPISAPGSIFDAYAGSAAFGDLLNQGKDELFLCTLVMRRVLLGMLCAAVAITVTAYIPNKFVALSSPLIFYYFVINAIPIRTLNPIFVLSEFGVRLETEIGTSIHAPVYALIWMFALGLMFWRGVKRRVQGHA
ncbi:MAG: hypothetical protein Q4D04_02095 [Clostridia bacterium]|nr:hypothetical protein [Clostridia bacterium]